MRIGFIVVSISVIILFGILGYFHSIGWWIALGVISPLIIMGYVDLLQKKHTILRNFPLIGNIRYLFEDIRPEVYQYFIESDIDGRPFNRTQRSIVYKRAKLALQTIPFGSQRDTDTIGYEWIYHSMYPVKWENRDPRVLVGGPECDRPYASSILNISAMSFGALGKKAIESLSAGARIGGFAHNTGEGGISKYHLRGGGDLIWQIGTGYFGCRDKEGNFDKEKFKKNASLENVRMIEVKISQGAKPGHGGVLPAEKNNKEIASSRGLDPHTTVVSPPRHSAFDDEKGLLDFISELREGSGGKPVGFKLCIGEPREFLRICKAIRTKGIYPDFITVDASNGGTGAAPMEFSDSMGMPLDNGIAFAHDALRSSGCRDRIKLFASGKIITGFDMIKVMALGADACYSARGMMFSLGCIQALRCNKNTCPTGIATHDPQLEAGLVINDKKNRVANFHNETVDAAIDMIEACGLHSFDDLQRSHIKRRGDNNEIRDFEELYPYNEVRIGREA